MQFIDPPLDFGSLDRPEPVQEQVTDPETVPRAWWRSNEEKTLYQGLDETLAYAREFLRKEALEKGPFDARISL